MAEIELEPLVDQRTVSEAGLSARSSGVQSAPISDLEGHDDQTSAHGRADRTGATSERAEKTGKACDSIKPRSSNFAWTTELVSYSIALAALLVIVVIVRARNEQPIPNWPISINFLVSVFTSILKAAMLMPVAEGISELKWVWFANPRLLSDMDEFDLASRGPRGSFRFIFRLPQNKLACLGAMITLLSLGIDPFTQLVVQTYECLTIGPGLATINRTNNYTAHGPGYLTDWRVDAPMGLAILEGVLNPPANATASLLFDCSSGNCTFPRTYSSLAICSSVKNISERVVPSGNNWKLPSGQNLTYHGTVFSSAETKITEFTEDTPLFEFEALMHGAGGVLAFTASLYPCIQIYGNANDNITISANQIQQTVISTMKLPRINMAWPYYSLAGAVASFEGIDCSSSGSSLGPKTVAARRLKSGKDYVIQLEHSGYISNVSDEHIAASQALVWYDPACTWTFGIFSSIAIRSFLGGIFGEAGNPNKVAGLWDTANGDLWLELLYLDGKSNLTYVEKYIERLADSMTAGIRRNGDATNSAHLVGEQQIPRTCIRFRAVYLAWTAFLLTSTAAFFSATWWRSRIASKQAGRGSWKSSSLALLWCGLEEKVKNQRGTLDYVNEEMKPHSELLEMCLTREVNAASSTETVQGQDSTADGSPLELDQVDSGTESTTDEETDSRSLRRGRWILQKERELPARKQELFVRSWASRLSNYIPI
ncbi:hypothetical protein EPUS_05387 [Endocarpon pusillum Z07020]|uniref:Uncharacterized protein n=1 Tax=Endocarpon pusillum (strain Z07020 / HMAS-L-300199) TaxID=1263415 RepID=U1HX16_ENDPU|nr:uncharacterized protein EPUS_05387 [Endocarpon pusillum Z07020]ERF73964.1 hypothetical protein EPUS_05387 [Endocarpon pusillum Z07020]